MYLSESNLIEGTTIKIESFAAHPQAIVKLLRGDADLLLTGTTQGWESFWDGNPIVAIGSYVWGVSSLCVKNPEIRSVHDLIGGKIALPFKNSPLDIQTRIILQKTGVVPDKDVEFVYTGFPQALLLLMEGKIEAAAFPEPLATTHVKTKNLIRLFEYQKAWEQISGNEGLSPQVTLFCTDQSLQKMRSFIPKLHDAIAKACTALSVNPTENAHRFSKFFSLPPEVLEESINRTSFRAPDFTLQKSLMLSYLSEVKDFFPGDSKTLSDRFFFSP